MTNILTFISSVSPTLWKYKGRLSCIVGAYVLTHLAICFFTSDSAAQFFQQTNAFFCVAVACVAILAVVGYERSLENRMKLMEADAKRVAISKAVADFKKLSLGAKRFIRCGGRKNVLNEDEIAELAHAGFIGFLPAGVNILTEKAKLALNNTELTD